MSHESISKAASTATYAGSTLSVGSAAAGSVVPPNAADIVLGLTLNQWTVVGIIFGMLVALVGLLVNVHFQTERIKAIRAMGDDKDPDGD